MLVDLFDVEIAAQLSDLFQFLFLFLQARQHHSVIEVLLQLLVYEGLFFYAQQLFLRLTLELLLIFALLSSV